MKKIFIFAFILISSTSGLLATSYTWTAVSSGSASINTNWSPTGVPGNGDDVVFNGTSSSNCTWDVTQVTSFSVLSGFNGSITMTGGTKTIRSNIVINSGTVVSTSGTLVRSLVGTAASFILGSGGTFLHNNGTFLLQLEGGDSYTFSGAIVLNGLNLSGALNSAGERFVNFGSNLSANTVFYSSLFASPDQISYQGTIHIKTSLDLSASINTNTLVGTNSANFIFDGPTAFIQGSSTSGMAYLPNITMSTVGNYSIAGILNITGNYAWTAGSFVPNGSTVNMYGTSATIGAASSFDNLVIQSGASVTFPGGGEVNIKDNLNAISGSNSTFPAGNVLVFDGTIQSISGILSPQSIRVFSGATSLSNALTLIDALTVESGATFNTNGFLTLHSDGSGTARIAMSDGTINGGVIKETFLPGGSTGWANLGTPGIQSQSVASWDTYVSSGGTNGLPMTCYGCNYDPSVAGDFMSVQGWDETTNDYDTLAANINSGTALTPGKGFWVYVGDGQASTNPLKLINTGAPVTGPQSIAVPINSLGVVLIANPYPSPIDWDAVYSSGLNVLTVDGAIYAWNADIGQTSYVPGVGPSNPAPNGIDQIVPAGQGFYVQNAGFGFTSLDFDETVKSPGSNPVVKTAESGVQKFRLKLAGAVDSDGMLFAFKSDATSFYDKKYDAKKMFQSPGYMGYPGAYDKYTTISCKDAFDVDYSIHSMAPLTESVSIPVLARVSTSGTYTISAYDFKDFTSCIGLKDRTDNSFHDLRQSDYIFTISDTTSAPRFDLVLCRDESINTVGLAQLVNSNSVLINQDQQGAFVKTAFSRNTKATISAYNIIGQKVMEDISVEGTATDTRLDIKDMQNQIVIVRVVTDKETSTKKIVMH